MAFNFPQSFGIGQGKMGRWGDMGGFFGFQAVVPLHLRCFRFLSFRGKIPRYPDLGKIGKVEVTRGGKNKRVT